MNTKILLTHPVIQKITQENLSGKLIISEKEDNPVNWIVYLNQGKLSYITSNLGQQERLSCLFKYFQPNLSDNFAELNINTETLEYKKICHWWVAKKLPLLNLRELIHKLSLEALAQILNLQEFFCKFVQGNVLEPTVINCSWQDLLDKAEKLNSQWQKFYPYITSGFTCLYIDSQDIYKFYSFWKNLEEKPEAKNFFYQKSLSEWLEILNQKKCIYEISDRIGVDPLTVARQFSNLIQEGSIKTLPFQNTESQLKINRDQPLIACIDDSKTVQKQIQTTLSLGGYQVLGITDPTTAITTLAGYQPILILLDINMPGVDGYELCKMLRRSRKFKDLPVVMLTGRDGIIDRLRAQLVGANHYLTKPCNPNELLQLVKNLTEETDPSNKSMEETISVNIET